MGALRAESLGDQVFKYFAEPAFFPNLQSRQSCLLKGGRGTGKTTLLRCLSYQGQAVLRAAEAGGVAEWPFYGFFWRINTNRVAAFAGPEIPDTRWSKLFGHYVNLELTDLVLEFLEWAVAHGCSVELGESFYEELSVSLNIDTSRTLTEVRQHLRRSRTQFQARINNIADSNSNLGLSMPGHPVDLLVTQLRQHEMFRKKKLFFLIDEYESLLDYQQELFNTFIKQSSDLYVFKIGVKEMGFRRHATINPHEHLSSPADYDVINIAEQLAPRFERFAEDLVASRLRSLSATHVQSIPSVRLLFESPTLDEEAVRLGVSPLNEEYRRVICAEGLSGGDASLFDALTPLQKFFVRTWSKSTRTHPTGIIRGLTKRQPSWIRRYGNYSFALLFSIRAGKPGRHKLYAGWRTICRLANANVRYLLELVAGMLQEQIKNGRQIGSEIPAEVQTDRAYEVGRKNLQELERQSDQAASLTKVVLSLGRVFEVLATSPTGHTPEVTQFVLPSATEVGGTPGDIERRVADLLNEAVNVSALVRYPGSKLQEPSSVRSYDYSLHPIFAALFGFSYRRKRKIEITEEEFLALVSEPKWAINRILMRQNRDPSTAEIPDQLRLFSSFYA